MLWLGLFQQMNRKFGRYALRKKHVSQFILNQMPSIFFLKVVMNTWLKTDRGPVKYQFALESLGNVKAQYLLTSWVFSLRHLVWLAGSADCCSESVTPLVRDKCRKVGMQILGSVLGTCSVWLPVELADVEPQVKQQPTASNPWLK